MSLVSNFFITQVKSEFQANSFETGNQLRPDVTGLSNGGFVVAYNSVAVADGQIALDFYNAAHEKVGIFAIPDDGGSQALGQPQVVELANGNVLVSWQDNQTGDAGRKGHIYTADGQPIGGEINFNPGSTADGLDDEIHVAALTDGGFVTSYSSGGHIYHGRYDSEGDLQGGGFFQVNAPGAGTAPVDSAVAALSNGGYVVTYTDTNPADQTIRARVYDANGDTVMGDKIIAITGDNMQSKVAGLANGNWAVVYMDTGWGGDDDGNSGITMQIFDAEGDTVTGFVHVNSPSSHTESQPDITVLENGFIVVSWTKQFSVTDYDIRARVFTAGGVAVTDEFSITTSGDADVKSAVAGLLSGQFVTAWQDNTSDGHGGRISATVNELVRATTGNDDDDIFTGDEIRDVVSGGGGADTINGASGNDEIHGGNGGDTLVGGFGADLLDGGIGIDYMNGGAGNDTYLVDVAGDLVAEGPGSSGVDLVRSSISFSLANAMQAIGSIENLTLIGDANINATGNGLDNLLIGNIGNNTLIGFGGADIMQGGAGNDLYGVAEAGDVVDESIAGSSGIDTVNATVSVNLSDAAHFKGAIENVALLGNANLNATGNGLNNLLTGNSGNNTLVGLGGADTMRGGAGNDLYGVAEAGDIVDESIAGSSGIDTVNASISININDAAHFKGAIENATLIGNANLSLTGNSLANVLTGNGGANVITGWNGNDTLTGGGGNDIFQFNFALNAATNVDTITDMNQAGNDTIRVENSIFTTLAAGNLAAGAFHIGAAAADAGDRIVYNSANGQLIYDSNGSAAGGATLFAILDTGLALTAADFFVV